VPRFTDLISSLVTEIRIRCDRVRYDKTARKAHIADADRIFSTTSQERAIAERNSFIRKSVQVQFLTPISELTAAKHAAQHVLDDATEKLAILTRHYKPEIDALYAQLAVHYSQIGEIKDRINGAFHDLNSAKSELDAWYRRASGKGIFTNRGRALPQSALFGQDIAQRDALKEKRSAAGRSIDHWRNQRAEIYREIESVKSQISDLKAARNTMYELKKSGFDCRLLNETAKNMGDEIAQLGQQINDLLAEKERYMRAERVHVDALQAEIQKINANRDRFIDEFDTTGAKNTRKRTHRAAWLDRHRRPAADGRGLVSRPETQHDGNERCGDEK
jgi:hypothetical protein